MVKLESLCSPATLREGFARIYRLPSRAASGLFVVVKPFIFSPITLLLKEFAWGMMKASPQEFPPHESMNSFPAQPGVIDRHLEVQSEASVL
jgi:hypothetical protein